MNRLFWNRIRRIVVLSGRIAGIGILVMAAITCTDIILRKCGVILPGAYDLVRITGGITIAAALPLTTAVKGHVAIEYFFHRMGHRGRIVVDSVMRILQTSAFLFATWAFIQSGIRLLKSGEVMPTLQCHIFWLAWVIAAMCFLTALVSLFHLFVPGEDFMAVGQDGNGGTSK